MDTGRRYWGSEGKNFRRCLRYGLPQGRGALPEFRQRWCPGPCLQALPRPTPPAYHRGDDRLLGHPPIGHHGSSRPEGSREKRVVAGRDRALPEPVTMHLFQPWLLNLILRIPGKGSEIQVPRPDPDLMNWKQSSTLKTTENKQASKLPLQMTSMSSQGWEPRVKLPVRL